MARNANGQAVATGAVILHGEWAEIKRMWVEEAARGHGLARRVLEALMTSARETGGFFVWKPEWSAMPLSRCTRRQDSDALRRSPTTSLILSACSWRSISKVCFSRRRTYHAEPRGRNRRCQDCRPR